MRDINGYINETKDRITDGVEAEDLTRLTDVYTAADEFMKKGGYKPGTIDRCIDGLKAGEETMNYIRKMKDFILDHTDRREVSDDTLYRALMILRNY